ncbi:MAG: thioredoxin domain-containing protein [Alistipes sp.]
MKKSLFAALFMSLVLIGCSNESEEEQVVKKPAKPIEMTTAEFNTKVADITTAVSDWKYLGDKPALVEFYATWCGPCKALAPILKELAAEYGDQIYIYKIDFDKERKLAKVFNISAIPTLLFIPMTGKPKIMEGVQSKTELRKLINTILLEK